VQDAAAVPIGDFGLGAGLANAVHRRQQEGGTSEGSQALPEAVLKKIFHDNAARWIPGTTAG
jgi:hypothetical protein